MKEPPLLFRERNLKMNIVGEGGGALLELSEQIHGGIKDRFVSMHFRIINNNKGN